MSFLTLSLPKEAANLFTAFEYEASRVDFRQATAAAARSAAPGLIEKRCRRWLSRTSLPVLKD
jgi:hypothetical protein